jgi:hypothetical protein
MARHRVRRGVMTCFELGSSPLSNLAAHAIILPLGHRAGCDRRALSRLTAHPDKFF